MRDLAERARVWLHETRGSRVVLSDEAPALTTERAVLFGRRYAGSLEPMPVATICAPRDGGDSFRDAGPVDEELNLSRSEWRLWVWRVSARKCLVATDAAVNGWPPSALPRDPVTEVPGWWDRMSADHFPGAEVVSGSACGEVAEFIVEGGEGTRVMVWLRRQLGGRELTGHLSYADYADGDVVFLDGVPATVAGVRAHRHWAGVLRKVETFPVGSVALIWIGRKDCRVRQSVAHLLAVVRDDGGVRLVDPTEWRGKPLIDPTPFELRVIRFLAHQRRAAWPRAGEVTKPRA
ncbi:toxin glutamine deamidase domain-containing protein [Saccharopolyspora phatthalungensis]|nr:toxin glutamine deamidase domain-containing protein [Saccharopolyspora phatthalungensis]